MASIPVVGYWAKTGTVYAVLTRIANDTTVTDSNSLEWFRASFHHFPLINSISVLIQNNTYFDSVLESLIRTINIIPKL